MHDASTREALRQTAEILSAGEWPHELVALRPSGDRPEVKPLGLFHSAGDLAGAAAPLNGTWDLYMVANPTPTISGGRAMDADVPRLLWFVIDLDPADRTSIVPKESADHLAEILQSRGWPEPLLGFSGRGWWLAFRTDTPNTAEAVAVRRAALTALRDMWSAADEDVTVDTSVHNPARLVRLFGSRNLKSEVDSYLCAPPRSVSGVGTVLLSEEAIAGLAPQEVERLRHAEDRRQDPSFAGEEFDAVALLESHGFTVGARGRDGFMDVDPCPTAPPGDSHGGTPPSLKQMPSGAWNYVCLHERCAGKRWQDVRALLDTEYASWVERGAPGPVIVETDEFDDEEDLPQLEPAIPETGFVRDYLDFALGQTMAPPEFHLVAGLWMVAALLAPRVQIKFGMSHFPAPIWPVLLARSGNLKSTPLRGALNLLDEATGNHLRLPHDFSREGFLKALAERPNGYAFFSEFGGLIRKTGRDYMAGTKDDLSDLFDGGRFERQLSGKDPLVIERPRLALLGATVETSLAEWIKAGDLEQGFLSRFLFVPSVTPTDYVSGLRAPDETGGDPTRQRLVDWLRALYLQPYANLQTPRLRLTDEAIDSTEEYDRRARAWDVDPLLEGLKNRLGVYVLKLATAYTYAEAREIVDAPDVLRARALLEFCRSRVWPLIESNPGVTQDARQIERFKLTLGRLAGNAGGDWVRQRDHQRAMRFKKRNYEEIKETLLEMEEIEERVEGASLGKSAVREVVVLRVVRSRRGRAA